MIGALTNHLWQSTLFAIAAGLMTIAFRKNHAKVRYWLWLSASLKFLIPFSMLIAIGSQLQWVPAAQKLATQVAGSAIQFTVEQISEPFAQAATPTPSMAAPTDWLPVVVLAMWLCGFLAIAFTRLRAWLRIRDAIRASTSAKICGARTPACSVHTRVNASDSKIQIRTSPGLLEPGVAGLFHPILLLPEGIAERLTPSQLEAVLAHELCHIRRRDNLSASLHMMVEALFWFHPLVWWIGARLVEERERACDEEVLSLGNQASVYADAILHVCKLYLESPLACISGVTGSDIRRRIEVIMSNRGVQGLNRGKKFLLVAAGTAALISPVLIGTVMGLGHAPAARAQLFAEQSPTAPTPKFDAASIKPCQPGDGPGRGGSGDMGANGGVNRNMPEGVGGYFRASPGRLDVTCGSILTMVSFAYVSRGTPLLNNPGGPMREGESIEGVPKWALAARYTIHAETDDPVANGPTQRAQGERGALLPAAMLLYGPMLQHLLEDRFQLKVRRVTEEAPLYALTVAKSGFKLKPMKEGDCLPDGPPEWPAGGKPACNWTGWDVNGPNRRLLFGGLTLDRIAHDLAELILDRNVIDRTGITGKFVFRLEYAPDENTHCVLPGCSVNTNSDIPPAATIFAALEQQLGLKLEPIKGPKEHIVVDHVEPPSEN
jgi:bla regulator protein blaR1